jgi:hypothetical protein
VSSSEEKRLDAMEKAKNDDPHKELSFEELADILELTIKYDVGNKIITFLIGIGTYTDEEQGNILFRAETTTGKSYIPLEIVKYFPEEDVEKIGQASPTSFFHKFGKKMEEEKVVEIDKDGKKKTTKHVYYEIDMSKRIYIFKDMPSEHLLESLRSLLSHDEKNLQIQFTNKNEKSGYRTQHIIIKGYPTFIFCTATSRVLDMQESTRFFVLSPDIEEKKIREAIILLAESHGNKISFAEKLNGEEKRIWLQNRVRDIKAENIRDVVIENPSKIAEDFIKSKKYLQPRHMRDFGRLLSLIKYWTILNCWTRKSENTEKGKIVYANSIDIEVGFILYETICEANEMGISPEIYRFYKQVFEPIDNGTGLTKQQICSAFLEVYHRPLGNRRLEKDIIPNLQASGLIYDVEGTGVGGKPKVYRLSKYMNKKENGEEIKDRGQVTLDSSATPTTLQDKIEMVLNVLAPKIAMSVDEIVQQTNGSIPKEEVPKLLQQLMNNAKIYQPDGYRYMKV